jgi:hypothetical protein
MVRSSSKRQPDLIYKILSSCKNFVLVISLFNVRAGGENHYIEPAVKYMQTLLTGCHQR